jgi:hypothetical protein
MYRGNAKAEFPKQRCWKLERRMTITVGYLVNSRSQRVVDREALCPNVMDAWRNSKPLDRLRPLW